MIASTMKSQRGKGGGGIGPEETLVAAPLTKGSATGEGVNQPGRRQEDDVNIVAFDTYNQSVSDTVQTLRDPNGTFGDALPAVFVSENQRAEVLETPIARQLTGGGGKPGQGYPAIREGMGVRRLTPRECERLQGLPDDWTLLHPKTPDSRRYSGLGDAVTANVAFWIGHRLQERRARELEAASPRKGPEV